MSKIVKTWDGYQGELLYIKGKIAFIKESNGEVWFCLKTDIIDFDEINMEEYYVKDAGKITYIYGVDLEEHIRVIEKLQHQLDQQKAMWKELKLWILDTLKQKRNSPKYYKLNDVLDKINELERDYKNE